MRKNVLPRRNRLPKENHHNSSSNYQDSDDFFLGNFDFERHSIPVQSTTTILQQDDSDWMDREFEGQLSIDVYQKDNNIIVKSTIAGVNPEDLDISVENDMLTIRGKRYHDREIHESDYFFQECYWGGFSRSIILPVDVQFDKIQAELDNGVLTITLPKAECNKKINVQVRE